MGLGKCISFSNMKILGIWLLNFRGVFPNLSTLGHTKNPRSSEPPHKVLGGFWKTTGMSMEVIVTIVSKLGYFTYLRDLQPTFTGVISHLLSNMDTLVG